MNIDTIISIIPILLKASIKTIELTVLSIVFGSIIGVVIAMIKLSSNRIISSIGSFYTWIFRGTPLLLQLYVFYYGLPSLGILLSPMQAATIGLSVNSGAYMAEIIRGGIMAVDKGQFEASKALGFTYAQTMRRIILPQAVRIVIPPVGNEFIAMIKDTSLVSSIAMEELLRKAGLLVSASGAPLEPYFVTACLYLIMTTLFTSAFAKLEKRLSIY
jgi:polar amino acid transport system permease protein